MNGNLCYTKAANCSLPAAARKRVDWNGWEAKNISHFSTRRIKKVEERGEAVFPLES